MSEKKETEATVEQTATATEKAKPATKKTTQAKPTTKKPTGKSGGFCVYLGPSIRGVITRGTVFNGPKAQVISSMATAIEKQPLIADLIVSGDTLVDERIKVKTPGNLLNVKYNKLASGQ